ncbi:MAG: hypothetical protein Q8P92_01315 [Candidatus Daviesbacteria bacterium]|nr:hypothetical protein [Candidatus Daviesbacteria bacterium]
MDFWKKWKYPYLTAVLISIFVAIILAQNQAFKDWLLNLGSLEYIGAIIAGMLFVSSFTVAISTVVIAIMTQNIHPMALALIGGVGAVMGDYLVFKLVRSHLQEELAMLFGKQETSHIKHLLHSKYIAWTLPIIGVFIIASPLPDEMGVSLLGISKISEARFILISYISNAVGILMIASVAKVI